MALGACVASAQVIREPGLFDNISLGVDGGGTTLISNHPFFKSMRPVVGIHLDKQITPTLALGVEGQFSINTTGSKTAFDQSYVGVYGDVDLFNLIDGYKCGIRPFTISAIAGAGWGHDYYVGPYDYNYFATKAGLDFKFNVSKKVTIDIEPSVVWNMTGGGVSQTTTAYNAEDARFNITAGVTYHFGDGFECVRPYDQAEVDFLNGQINALRSQLDGAISSSTAWENRANALAAQLAACEERPAEQVTTVVTEIENTLNTVRYVFFRIGSSAITADQMPNVEQIAAYLNNHPEATVTIKGYASQDGPEEVNIRLANARAQSVRDALVNRYHIAASRITAEGQGIGHMFSEESWNRVSICIIND